MTQRTNPLLLFDGECGVCRHIAHWVRELARRKSGETTIDEQPIGDDPEALRLLHPDLDIWDAYATIHVLMPDGSMKLGGEAVAEVLRNLPGTKWLARSFAIRIFGFRPFQMALNVAYAILADIRPLFGCESCGTGSLWMKPLLWIAKWVKTTVGDQHHPRPAPNFTPI
jgi:predicted DCC family thiol-disulfide oxidoreductase YuxK